jgi:prepilin-type N-terminal cleavage/methylation domain-containing protein
MNKVRDRARAFRAGAAGFSLIEVVIAIAVIAVTFIGLIGLLGLGVANDQASSQQTVATNIASSILADLRSTPTYSATSTRFGLTLPTTPTGAVNTSLTPLAGLTPYYLYFDNSPSFLPLSSPLVYTAPQSPVPAGAVYVATVYLTRITYIGPTATSSLPQSSDMVRVVVSWPAQASTVPSGNVDVISQFLIH